MRKNQKLIYKMVITAIFSTLCFVGVYIKIQLPVGMVHLGNFICILASLLCGGVVGGTAGSLGMGLADIFYYGGFSAGVVRTILVKFFMGYLAGASFRFLRKRKLNPILLNCMMGLVFLGLFIFATIACAMGGIDYLGKHITIHFTVPIFLGIVVILIVITLLLQHKLNLITRTALASISIATIFNVAAEIYLKALLYYWIDSKYVSFEGAYAYALSGLPGVFLTASITCILCALVFYPLYKATRNFVDIDDLF